MPKSHEPKCYDNAMKIVFIHQNFPGQFPHIARHLAADKNNQVFSIAQKHGKPQPNINHIVYAPARVPHKSTHHYLINAEMGVLNGQAVAKVLEALKQKGVKPDVIVGHLGWGETLFAKDVFPDVPLVNYFEFFYKAVGADTDFDPEFPNSADDVLRIRTKNAVNLLGLHACDAGISPTNWQRSLYPLEFQPKISVIHEGINTDLAKPDQNAEYWHSKTVKFSKKDKIVTFVARNLEPYRGFHIFMRAIAHIQAAHPDCTILVVGSDGVSYGRKNDTTETYRAQLLKEVKVDQSRVHFLGKLDYANYLKILQISSVHVYLTVPFVLSWSMLEAMAAGCVVVGSDTPPVREVIEHEKNGLLVDFLSPQSVANGVNKVLENPAKMQHLGVAARKLLLERYQVNNSIEQYTQLLQNVIR